MPFKTKDYLRKRLTRLIPVYYLTNIAAFALMMVRCGFVPCSGVEYPWENVAVQGVLTALVLTSWTSWPFTYFRPFNLVTWTISTMFFFYICFPAIVPRLQRLPKQRLAFFMWQQFVLQAALFLLIYASPLTLGRKRMLDPITSVAVQQVNLTDAWDETSYWAARTLPPIRLPVFVMGCCAAFQRLDMARRASLGEVRPGPELSCAGGWRRNAAVLVAIWMGLVLAAITAYQMIGAGVFGPTALGTALSDADVQTWPRVFLELVMPLVFCDLIVVLALDAPAGGTTMGGATLPSPSPPIASAPMDVRLHRLTLSFFHSPPLQFLGEISMSFYMVHTLVMQALQEICYAFSWGGVPRAYHGACPYWLAILSMGVSLLLGWAITEFFEKPVARCIVRHTGPRVLLAHTLSSSPSRTATALDSDTRCLTQAASNIRPVSTAASATHANLVGAMAYQQSALEPAAASSYDSSSNRAPLVRSTMPTGELAGDVDDDASGQPPVGLVRKRDRNSV